MILITGGAGFIGSHLVDRLVAKNKVKVIDNLSASTLENISRHVESKKTEFVKWDLSQPNNDLLKGIDEVYHFAAFPDVKLSAEMTKDVFRDNVTATFNVLESCRKSDVEKVVFASTSTVYGIAPTPTPEKYPCNPISNYAATKVAGEALVRAYSETYGIKSVILRMANIFGPRSNRGVAHDFFFKLKKNPKTLEILGDGEQNKSYLYIDDCIEAILVAAQKAKQKCGLYNVGSEEQIKAKDIASIVIDQMDLGDVGFTYTGGKQGWAGDVPVMLLDVTKLKKLGWKPRVSTEQGIRMYIEWLKENHKWHKEKLFSHQV